MKKVGDEYLRGLEQRLKMRKEQIMRDIQNVRARLAEIEDNLINRGATYSTGEGLQSDVHDLVKHSSSYVSYKEAWDEFHASEIK